MKKLYTCYDGGEFILLRADDETEARELLESPQAELTEVKLDGASEIIKVFS